MPDPQRTPMWLWLNLLSLDAPLVAVVWQDFIARIHPSVLHPAGRWTLGLTVWAIYLADRILDLQLNPQHSNGGSLPHKFYKEHAALAWAMLATVISVDVLVAALWLRPAVATNGLILSMGVGLYLGAIPPVGPHPLLKQALAACLFCGGVFLVAWTGPGRSGPTLPWMAASFAALCFANLRLTSKCQFGTVFSIQILVAVAAAAATRSAPWQTAIGISAAGLLLLAYAGPRISRSSGRVLTDAALLAPLFLR